MVKITIFSPRAGRVSLSDSVAQSRDGLRDAIEEAIFGQMVDEMEVNYSHGKMKDLVNSIKKRAGNEAMAVFPRAVAIIRKSRTINRRTMDTYDFSNPRPMFDAGDISGKSAGSRDLTLNNRAIRWGGSVSWRDLSPAWVIHKYGTTPQNYNKFFAHRGTLIDQLSQKVRWAAQLGGVGVSAKYPAKGKRIDRKKLVWVLGEIDVHIFPGLQANMLPMLQTGSWTSHNSGEFEKKFFPGKMGEKLAGPKGFHRPLMLPLIQFWTAFRIPRAIDQAIHNWANNRNRGEGFS